MKHTAIQFWRDEAKFGWFSPGERSTRYVRFFASAATVGGSIKVLAPVFAAATMDWGFLVSLVAFMSYPVAIIVDLYRSGGDAGAKLLDDRDRHSDKTASMRISQIFTRLRQDLASALNTRRPPVSLSAMQQRGMNDKSQSNAERRILDKEMADRVRSVVAGAMKEVSDINPSILLTIEIPPEVDTAVIRKKVELFLQQLDATEKHL